MLKVTQDTSDFADRAMAVVAASNGICVRLDLDQKAKSQLLSARALSGDFGYEHGSETVLLVTKQAVEQLAGKAMDTKRTAEDIKIILRSAFGSRT